MERETITLSSLSGENTITLKTYLTGKEKREIKAASIPKKINYNPTSDGVNEIDLSELTNAAEDAAIRNIVVSVNGKTDVDFVEAILAMKSTDSDYFLAEIKNVADGLSEEKKTI